MTCRARQDASQLELTAVTARALLETCADLELAGLPMVARRRADLAELFSAAPVPVAAFRGSHLSRMFASASWLKEFARMPPAVRDALEDAYRLGERVRIAALCSPMPEHDALERVYQLVIEPVRTGAEQFVTGVVACCRDITDAEIARRLDGRPTALVWSGRLGHEADHYSPGWFEYTQRAPDALRWQEHVHPDHRWQCERALAHVSDQVGELCIKLCRHDGAERWHRVRFVLAAPRASRWFAIADDVHEATEATTAHRLKDRFLAAVSHELRTPITTLLLWEQILRDNGDSDELRASALAAIRQNAQEISRLVADLVDVGRSVDGALHVERTRVAVDGVLSAAIQAAVPGAHEKQVAVVSDCRARLGSVRADADRLRQVFDRLLSHALNSTPSGGTIRVTASRDTDAIEIAISDTGRGIAREQLPHVFEPFPQADEDRIEVACAASLDLALASRLVALHDGSLMAESAGVGRGSTFTVRLPALRKAAGAAKGPPVQPASLEGLSVLLIDDDARMLEVMSFLLQHAGAQVQTHTSTLAARSMLERTCPAVIVCDITMPDEDGYSFVRRLRASALPARDVPVIALTARASERDRQVASAAGFDAHLVKPVTMERLASAIADVVGSRLRASP